MYWTKKASVTAVLRHTSFEVAIYVREGITDNVDGEMMMLVQIMMVHVSMSV